MRQYTIKRIGLFLPTVLLVTILVFVLMRIIPGDPALAILEDEGGGSYTQEDLARLRHEIGTDRPIDIQYFTWIAGDWIAGIVRCGYSFGISCGHVEGDAGIRGVVAGDFGNSLWFKSPVMGELKDRIPVTVELAIFAMVLAMVVAVPLGVASAIKPDSKLDYTARALTLAGIALPTFFTAILIILLLVTFFGWLPPLGYANFWKDPSANLQQMFVPAWALAGYDLAFIARVTRSSMREILREDYMRTARSKGLTERVVLARHGLKNAFLPILTISGWQFGRLFRGTIIIETIFLVPGMGRILIESIGHRDYVMIQAVVVIIGLSIVTINLLIDLLYGWLDPRIRFA